MVARARAWIQSLWAERLTSAGQCYLFVLGFAMLIAVAVAPRSGLIVALGIFGIGWTIAYWLKHSILADEKIVAARSVLLDIAFHECCCKPDSIIDALGAPELVCKSIGKGYCHVCKSREVLERSFPGAIEKLMQERLNGFAFGFKVPYIPEDLAASYGVTPEELAELRERKLDQVGPERFVPLTFTVRKPRK
jgi:hypothetical protein